MSFAAEQERVDVRRVEQEAAERARQLTAEAAAEAAEARRVEHQADRNAARLADLLKRHE